MFYYLKYISNNVICKINDFYENLNKHVSNHIILSNTLIKPIIDKNELAINDIISISHRRELQRVG